MLFGGNAYASTTYGSGTMEQIILPPFSISVVDTVIVSDSVYDIWTNILYINVTDTAILSEQIVVQKEAITLNINVEDIINLSELLGITQINIVNATENINISDELERIKMISFVREEDTITLTEDPVEAESFVYSPSNFGPFGEDGEGN